MKTPLSICTLFMLPLAMSIDADSAAAQNYRLDYSGPVHYQPEDPWVRGKVFQAHTGHAGWFYNCDHQEDKRFSPYIVWKVQPFCRGPEKPLKWDIFNQLCEVRRRICWGGRGCLHRTDRLLPDSGCTNPVFESFDPYVRQPANDVNLNQNTPAAADGPEN